MRRYVTRKTFFFRRLLLVITVLTAALIALTDHMLSQYADTVCHSSCSQYGEELINNAVSDALQSFELADIIKNDICTESFSGYSVDSELVNEISSFLLKYINDRLSDEMHSYVSVPAGAFTGISFLSGSGPQVRIDIYAVGNPDIKLTQRFESAGINQTLFELYADISISFAAVMPSESVSVTVSRQVLLAQNVIIGEVPQIYYPQSE